MSWVLRQQMIWRLRLSFMLLHWSAVIIPFIRVIGCGAKINLFTWNVVVIWDKWYNWLMFGLNERVIRYLLSLVYCKFATLIVEMEELQTVNVLVQIWCSTVRQILFSYWLKSLLFYLIIQIQNSDCLEVTLIWSMQMVFYRFTIVIVRYWCHGELL